MLVTSPSAEAASAYGVVRQAVPVYRSAAAAGGAVVADRCGQVRSLEFIALPGTPFRVMRDLGPTVEVTTPAYTPPAGVRLFVRSAFLEFSASELPPRPAPRPDAAKITETLRSAVGLPYVWGGNLRQGVEGRYRGLDCSGLLYEATNGFTPRNTSDLVSFGEPVAVAGLTAEQIAARLRPLDLIVWNGHLIVVLDRDSAIESILRCGAPGNGGVTITPLRQRLRHLLKQRSPADTWPPGGGTAQLFVVRRWFEGQY
ncbi:glycoside hydrolase [Trichlorobacter ammonificans]|uniref:glycoside hydrolase n=1 Tax=Trichlorobacter ammonificans TaxID=2916410 RepID=UPI0027379807|nr:glycoside hydrolase [Trichlorobacter ammonificans]